jgi:hypothetical protein
MLRLDAAAGIAHRLQASSYLGRIIARHGMNGWGLLFGEVYEAAAKVDSIVIQ